MTTNFDYPDDDEICGRCGAFFEDCDCEGYDLEDGEEEEEGWEDE